MTKYVNNNGVSEMWLNIKNWVTSQLLGKSDVGHTHNASDITSGLSSVATSGSYNDLSNKPTIPTVNNATLTIQKNGSNVATFTANASSNVTCNITVPTDIDQLTNGNGFITSEIDSSGTGWVRFKSGLQICYGNVTNTNGLERGITEFSFPKAFNAKPNVVVTPGDSGSYIGTVRVRSSTTWVLNCMYVSKGSSAYSTNSALYNFIAIGTWE